ncbi:MAG TPA: hypothetical protein VKY40_10180 [Halanaerobiales bacterium]|nr:hypothetical protein [Halanaerobiales bacterium]
MKNGKYKNSREKIKRTKILLITYLLILLLLTYIFIMLVINDRLPWFTGIIFIPFYYLLHKKYGHFKLMKNLLKLQKEWGQAVKRERDFNTIRLLFDNVYKEAEATDGNNRTYLHNKNCIDEQTWQDLNFDQIYSHLDFTLTSPGETVLYNILRTPLFTNQKIKKRAQIIKGFQNNKGFREKIGLQLLKLGRQKGNNLVNLLWGIVPEPAPYGFILNILALLSLLIIFSFYFLGGKALVFLMIMVSINMWVIRFFKKRYFYQLPVTSIKHLVSLIKTASNISELDCPLIEDYQRELKLLLLKAGKVSGKVSRLIPKEIKGDLDVLYEYINILFLIEIRSFNATLYAIKEYLAELQKIYLIIGEIDSLLSTASYRASMPYYCCPLFYEKSEASKLDIKDAYHPLLKDPVANSIKMDGRGVIITGSNMAGKSTFLRTAGLNVLLAQTISTCPAKTYKGTMMKVISSISRADNIMQGKSFYFKEAERLLKLIESSRNNIPSLCIIDELLSGTNSKERLAASREILNYLARNNMLTIVATHDLDLAEKLSGEYDCYHFTDNVTDKGLDFDYTLKRGIAVTTNAIKLLQYLKYPVEIVDKAFAWVKPLLDRDE